jgi:hypothetical protein
LTHSITSVVGRLRSATSLGVAADRRSAFAQSSGDPVRAAIVVVRCGIRCGCALLPGRTALPEAASFNEARDLRATRGSASGSPNFRLERAVMDKVPPNLLLTAAAQSGR